MLTDEQADLIERHISRSGPIRDLRCRAARALASAGGSMLRATLYALLALKPWQGMAFNHYAFRSQHPRIGLSRWLCRELGLPDPEPDPLASIRAAVANAKNLYAVGERGQPCASK